MKNNEVELARSKSFVLENFESELVMMVIETGKLLSRIMWDCTVGQSANLNSCS